MWAACEGIAAPRPEPCSEVEARWRAPARQPCGSISLTPLPGAAAGMPGNFEKDAWGLRKGRLGISERKPGECEASDLRRST